MPVTIGKPAPDFKLFNTEKKEIALSDYRGKNLLVLFFPLAFTSTCTAELCYIRDHYNIYNELNTEVIGISIDSLFVLDKYKKDQNFNFELLSDFNKTASTAYDVLYEEFVFGMKGVSKRSAFIIDKQGAIQYAEVLEKASDQPNYENIKTCLEGLN